MRREVCLSISPDVLRQVDAKRGELISRSRMVEHLIAIGLANVGPIQPLEN